MRRRLESAGGAGGHKSIFDREISFGSDFASCLDKTNDHDDDDDDDDERPICLSSVDYSFDL